MSCLGGTHLVKRLCCVQIEKDQAELSENHAEVVALPRVRHRDVANQLRLVLKHDLLTDTPDKVLGAARVEVRHLVNLGT